MRVLFVAAELSPIVKVGGLGDVIGTLPQALKKLGIDVSAIIPRYTFIDKAGLKVAARDIPVSFGGKTEKIWLYEGKIPGSSAPLFFVENSAYLSTGPAPYFDHSAYAGGREEIERFAFFSKAVYSLVERGYLKPDIVHAHDWHTGALMSLMKRDNGKKKGRRIKTIFTIHNLENQGKWNANEINKIFSEKNDADVFTRFGDDYNFIAEGILNADWLTTVSPTYAEEILTKQYGNGLEEILSERRTRLVGILNGIDTSFFDPEHDQKIFENFSIKNIQNKLLNKEALSHATGTSLENAPLFGMVSRLTDQKGIDLVIKALRMFAGKHDARFIFLGSGIEEYEKGLLKLQEDYPEKIITRVKFDETLAHRIYAASDFFLMPSRFEPCGLGQMIAMRYGAIPIVRKTGGLSDTVENMRNGFVFEKPIDLSLEKTMRQAYEIYKEDRAKFLTMRREAMKENFDFSISAKKYKKLYQSALRKK